MNWTKWLIAVISTGLAYSANAHTHLKSSTPADQSVLERAPQQLELHFSEAARLTALNIQPEGGTAQKLSPLPSQPTADASVALPKLAPGKYLVSWRVVSDDSHVMAGQLHFTVSESAKVAATTAH